MRAVSTIARREWSAYTVSPVAYVLAAIFLAISGFLFALILINTRQATLRYVFENMNFLLLFLAPLITMRLLAEERRTGTVELLLTLPFRDSEVVVGKFLASFLLYAVILVPTLWYVVLLRVLAGAAPDAGPLLSGYLGLLLQGGVLLAVGLFASSLTSNQVVAAVIAFALALGLWLVGALGSIAGGQAAQLLQFLTLPTHFYDFARGVIDLRSVVYHLSLIAGFLFLTYTSLQTRRWL
ncbi:MAG: ABC transporter permease subunit [Chloroflexi bacterium]|nr:ABC transporter permease subunit [Chloroflexota bacterium]